MILRCSVIIALAMLVFKVSAYSQAAQMRDKGIELYRSGKFTECIQILEKIVSAGEADHFAVIYLGAAYVKTGKEKEAREIFRKINSFKTPPPPIAFDHDIELIRNPSPRFSDDAKRGISFGEIRVAVELNHDGNVGFVFPFSATSQKLEEGAIAAAKGIRFKPAVMAGKPVDIVRVFVYTLQVY